MERWLPVVGFEGLYEVSDQGRVRSLARTIRQKNRWGTATEILRRGKTLRPRVKDHGHLSVQLGRGNVKHVHDLVLKAFRGSPAKGFECRHLDGNPGNNALSNVVWGTRRRNTQDRKWHAGTTTTKLRPQDVVRLRSLFGTTTNDKLAAQFGISRSMLQQIKSGRVHSDV